MFACSTRGTAYCSGKQGSIQPDFELCSLVEDVGRGQNLTRRFVNELQRARAGMDVNVASCRVIHFVTTMEEVLLRYLGKVQAWLMCAYLVIYAKRRATPASGRTCGFRIRILPL